jgi:hypothetical protein
MLTKRISLLGVFLILGLLLPLGASASTKTVLGSVVITGSFSDGQIVGIMVIHNNGLEKTISKDIPSYTFPVFVDVDEDDATGAVINKRLDTAVLLTNATAGTLNDITLSVMDASGAPLASTTFDLDPHESVAIFLSDLL